MKKAIKKVIATACVAATICSAAVVSAGALTRRLYGDVDGDGVVSILDVELTLNAAVGNVTLDKYQFIAADVNNDGNVTAADSLEIRRFIEGLSTSSKLLGTYFVY